MIKNGEGRLDNNGEGRLDEGRDEGRLDEGKEDGRLDEGRDEGKEDGRLDEGKDKGRDKDNQNAEDTNNKPIDINNTHHNFETQFVHNFYDNKSKEFNITRQRHWPKTKEFLDKFYKEGIVLDNGCGNGRCIINKNIIGLDFSKNLLKEAKIKKDNVLIRGDGLNLPFLSNSFDLIMSIAVIHHFSTKERRSKALKEIKRVLKPKGKCLLYVWDEETKYKKKFELIKNNDNKDFNNFSDKDYFVLWNKEIKRYYYLFDLKELKTFCEEQDFKIIEIGKEQESLYVIMEK